MSVLITDKMLRSVLAGAFEPDQILVRKRRSIFPHPGGMAGEAGFKPGQGSGPVRKDLPQG